MFCILWALSPWRLMDFSYILFCYLLVNFLYTTIEEFYYFDLLVALWYFIDLICSFFPLLLSSSTFLFYFLASFSQLFLSILLLILKKKVYFIFSAGINYYQSSCLFLVSFFSFHWYSTFFMLLRWELSFENSSEFFLFFFSLLCISC